MNELIAPIAQPANRKFTAGAERRHILLIDDEDLVVRSVERHLRFHQYDVTVATSGPEGLEAARRRRPNLVVLDVLMPGMDGYEVCRQMRLDPQLADLPILFLTARGKAEDKVAGLRLGADDYLTKPYNPDEFILRVHAILKRAFVQLRPESAAPAQLIVRDLALDCHSCVAITPHRSASLSPIQFDLLHFFMTNAGQAFTPATLLHDVLDFPANSQSLHLVEGYINALREKIEADPINPTYIVQSREGFLFQL